MPHNTCTTGLECTCDKSWHYWPSIFLWHSRSSSYIWHPWKIYQLFAHNRRDYVQNIFDFTANTYAVDKNIPRIMEKAAFWKDCCYQDCNSIHQQWCQRSAARARKKIFNGDGGLRVITNTSATIIKYCLTAPFLWNLSKETRHVWHITHRRPSTSPTLYNESIESGIG